MTEITLTTNCNRICTGSRLGEATNRIYTAMTEAGKQLYNVAIQLYRIDSEQLYAEGGYESTLAYAEDVFKLKKSAVYNFIKIGKEYTDILTLGSNLPHNEIDFTTSQISALLPLKSHKKAVELVKSGDITPEMTVEELKEVVKVNKPEKKSKNADESADSAESTEIEAEKIDPETAIYDEVSKILLAIRGWTELSDVNMIKTVRKAVNDYAKALRDKPIDDLFKGTSNK